MIKNSSSLSAINRDWQGIEKLRERLKRSAAASTIGGTFPFDLANAAHNLPFIHACSVLNNVLRDLADEGYFASKARTLGALVNDSEQVLTWIDYSRIKNIVTARNPQSCCARW